MTVELPPSLASGRFQIQQRPVTAPGNCSVCGSVERPVLDFGTTIDYYGAVLLCTHCIESAHALMVTVGVIEAGASAGAVPLLSDQNLLNAGSINEYVLRATDSIDRLRSILAYVTVPVPDAEELPVVDAEQSGELPDAVSGNDSAFDELINESRPDDVPSDSGSIFNL